MTPQQMIDYVLAIEREHIWDMGGIGGLLKGDLFQQILESYLPVQTFEECKIPLGVTAYDLLRFKTKCITTGNIAQAVRASCTFPGLFQPVIIDNSPHIDGGVWDDSGLMSMGQVKAAGRADATATEVNSTPSSADGKKLIVNVVCGRGRLASSKLPTDLQGHRLLTIVMDNIPMVTPFSMNTMGPVAYNVARLATLKALEASHIQELEPHHWCCYVDGNEVSAESRGEEEAVGHKRKAHDESVSSSGEKHQRLSSGESVSTGNLTHELLRVPSLSFLNSGVHEFEHPVEECLRKDVAAVSRLNRTNSSSASSLNLSSYPSYSDLKGTESKASVSKGVTHKTSSAVATTTPAKKKKSTAVVNTATTPVLSDTKKRVTRSAVKKKLSKMLD
eukprot:gene24331-30654_t